MGNRKFHRCLLGVALLAMGAGWHVSRAEDPAPLSKQEAEKLFAVKVLPLLKTKCFACHGGDPDDIKGDYDLQTLAGMLKGGESEEPSLVPGKPEDSSLFLAVQWDGLEMPPKENDRLTDQQIDLVRKWIAAGAPWPAEEKLAEYRRAQWGTEENEDGLLVATSGGLGDDWTYRRYKKEDIWAFQTLTKPQVPEAADHPVDAFVRQKIHDAGLAPAKRADPRTLIRRATYDLIGLPPTPSEIEDFLAAWKEDDNAAWTALIDRLLDSPQYGEHWGQHWLDVVRYADTSGFSNDWERSNAWRYRDYVIRSFNQDKPYNKFIIEQIAGDELDGDDPEMLVATGFLRMGPWEHTAMTPDAVSRQIYLDDLVNSTGQTFLSTAMRCCKCHDHKFDPLPTRDYYRMYAAFATTQPAERAADFLPQEDRSGFDANRKHVKALLDFATQERDALYAKREEAAKKWYADRGRSDEYKPEGARRNLKTKDKPRRFEGLTTEEEGILKVREQDVRIWTRRLERFQPLVQSVYTGGDGNQKSQRLRMPDSKKKWEIDKAKVMPDSHIYAGGSVFAQTDSVTPGVLSGLGLAAYSARKNDAYALPRSMERRRLAMARWIANPNNPLTSRSIVNRIWLYHFGRGIAGNPNNFGSTGKKPTHPELLDWLASTLVGQKWSIKSMHHLIMSSETYKQASSHDDVETLREKDPNNDLLCVFEPRRLTAEELRDSMLSISGELNLQAGGLPIQPMINREVALAPRMLQFTLAPAWQPSPTRAQRNRRSIYAYRVRGLSDPLLEVFNKPGSDESCEMRDSASVTPQVFSLMNSDVATSRSIAMAARIVKEADTPPAQIDLACRLALGDAASEAINEKLLKHYQSMVDYHHQHKPDPVVYPNKVTRSVVEEMSGDPFDYEEYLDIFDEDFQSDLQAADVDAETRAMADVCLLLLNSNAFIYVY